MKSAILNNAITLFYENAGCLGLVWSSTFEGALRNKCCRIWHLINTRRLLPDLAANLLHLKIATLQVQTATLHIDEANLIFLSGILQPVEALAQVDVFHLILCQDGFLAGLRRFHLRKSALLLGVQLKYIGPILWHRRCIAISHLDFLLGRRPTILPLHWHLSA